MELPKIIYGKEVLGNLDRAKKLEWIITNGLDGYSSSTVVGANTRKYHGVLVAAEGSKRIHTVHSLQEALIVNGKRYELSTNFYEGAVYPKGYSLLESFEISAYPRFIWKVPGAVVEKTLVMPHENNAVVVRYRIPSSVKAELEVIPLVTMRDLYGEVRHKNFQVERLVNGFVVNDGDHRLFGRVQGGFFELIPEEHRWYWNFLYPKDVERGDGKGENAYAVGKFRSEGEEMCLLFSFREEKSFCVKKVFEDEEARKKSILERWDERPEWFKWLLLASDMHIIRRVRRGNRECSIVAGYHWFGEWGRDTFISLPGLLLRTKRYDEARKMFLYWSKWKYVPNLLSPFLAANSVDSTLWYIVSLYEYYRHTNDLELIKKLWSKLESMLKCYVEGTEYFRLDEDGLIRHDKQATWMDAMCCDKVFTPRTKAVEVQALWYNALKIVEFFGKILGKEVSYYQELAEKAKKAFDKFWNGEYFWDSLDRKKLTPNQVIALSLPFKIVDEAKAKSALLVVKEKLYTPKGLRTLEPGDANYHGRYQGNRFERDSAYHNGTVWTWLLSPFVKALHDYGLYEIESRVKEEIKSWVIDELRKFGVGTIGEIFDGDAPHESRGCISQAWSIASLLEIFG